MDKPRELSPETEVIRSRLQARIEQVNSAYAESEQKLFSQYQEAEFLEIPSETASSVIKGENILIQEPSEPVYLASIAKIAISSLFDQIVSKEGDTQIDLNAGSLIAELIGRKQLFVVSDNPDIRKVLEVIFKNYLNSELPTDKQELEAVLKHFEEDYYDIQSQELKPPLNTALDSYSFSIKTLQILSLKYSANLPVNVFRQYLLKYFGSYEEYARVLGQMTKGFSPTKSIQTAGHWVQPDANVGYLSEFLKLQHKIVSETPESELVENMKNNEVFEEPFFDFTGSETAKKLIALGYSIVEKTGYYNAVGWVESLAARGLPVHLPFLSCVTIIDPTGKVVGSFAHYKAVAVRMPQDKIRESESNNGEQFDLEYPNYDSHPYQAGITEIYNKTCPVFRSEIVEVFNQNFPELNALISAI